MIELANDDLEVEDSNVMLKIGGKSYRCPCGANVFSRLTPITEGWLRYRCNGCEQEMEAA
jgi:predicted SprT family Zn-dependent metalloprotease